MWSNLFTKNKSHILISAFHFFACKKKNDPIPEPAKPCENDIDISIRGNQISSLKMYYNDKAKLAKIGTESSDYDYQYEADKIKVSASGIPYYEISLTNGKATKIMESEKANYQDLSYNADGYLIKVKPILIIAYRVLMTYLILMGIFRDLQQLLMTLQLKGMVLLNMEPTHHLQD